MPGTIQVSVLEFKSSSSSSASSLSVKVSIGKRDYQTQDNGDFSFPLTTLRDDLVVALLDADGNSIAHTGVKTLSIVEKGSWVDIFPFEGGGHVHLKLQFTLSEEDRSRIRSMRESAIKNKKANASLPESSSVRVDQKVSVRSEGASVAPKIQETEVPLREENQKEAIARRDTALPLANVELKPLSVRNVLSHMQSSGSEFPRKKDSVTPRLDDDSLDKSERQGPLGKTPSNVRKMISALESNQDQDARSPKKATVMKLQHNKVGKADPFKDQNVKDVRNEPSVSGKKAIDSRNTTTETEGKEIRVESLLGAEPEVLDTKEQMKPPIVMTSRSTYVTTTLSKKTPEDPLETNIEATFNQRSNSVFCSEDDNNPFGNLDMWIFPSNTRHLCMTTAGKEVANLLGASEAETHLESEKKGNLPHGSHKKGKDRRIFPNLRKSKPENSADDAAGGLVGQVIKVAVIVGFGVLVLLTRQKEPRKRSRTKPQDDSFSIQDYMDEQMSF